MLLWSSNTSSKLHDVRCCAEAESFLSAAAPPSSMGQKWLFLDDHEIDKIVKLHRTLHHPKAAGRVIRADQPWEGDGVQIRSGPSWNSDTKLWMMWYEVPGGSAYAVSHDLVHWEKPVLGARIYDGSTQNNLLPEELHAIFYDEQERDPARRYKGFLWVKTTDKPPAVWKLSRALPTRTPGLFPAVSPDGIHWKLLESSFIFSGDEFGMFDDPSYGIEYHLFHDTQRKVYVATVRQYGPYKRAVYMSLSRDFEHWTDPKDCLIFHAQKADQEIGAQLIRSHLADPNLRHPTLDRPEDYRTDIYALPIFLYQGLYVGMPTVFHQSRVTNLGSDGLNTTELAVSRDLLLWQRVARGEQFIPLSSVEGGMNYDTAQIFAANHPVIQGGEIWFLYTGLKWRIPPSDQANPVPAMGPDGAAVCLAKLRLDGFVSLDAGAEVGEVVTKPFALDGRTLHINAQTNDGEIRAEILDAQANQALAGFGVADSIPVRGDQLDAALVWRHSADLHSLAGRTVRLRFLMRNASLYSYWLRP